MCTVSARGSAYEPSMPFVYGCIGSRSADRAGCSSTICPAYMIMIRSADSSTVPMSWLMNSTAKPSSFWSRRTLSRIERWTTTSRPVVGSSRMTSRGLSASAIASATRCFMPPDSSCG